MTPAPRRPVIDWDSPTRLVLTRTMDLRHLFTGHPARLSVRSEIVIVEPYRIAHITEKSDVRMQVLRARPDLIFHALEAPEIIEATPPQKRDMPVPHYSQTFIVENAQTPKRMLAWQ